MNVFWVKFAEKYGDSAFAHATLPSFDEWAELNKAGRAGGLAEAKKKLATMSPVWDFSGPKKASAPTGWAEFTPTGEAFLSKDLFEILKPFAHEIVWQSIPSLTGVVSSREWGKVDGFPLAKVLNKEKSAISPSGALWRPILDSLPEDLPDVFHPEGTYAIFVSERAKKKMAASKMTGFSFEVVSV